MASSFSVGIDNNIKSEALEKFKPQTSTFIASSTLRKMELDEAVDINKDDYLLERNTLLRDYQMKLFEIAKRKNSIIYLPTGSGKTLIAIHVLCSRTNEVRRPLSEGGKRCFFLTTTKVMVHQVAKVIQTQTKFEVMLLTGEMNVDLWNLSKWRSLFERKQVFVLTGEIMKTVLQLGFISASQISLLVFDECHHAINDHPYRLVMKAVMDDDSIQRPLILGLSSILLNVTPKISQVQQYIQSLEATMNAKVVTETQFQEVMSFSANPVDKLLSYKKDPSTPVGEHILGIYDRIIDTLGSLIVKSPLGTTIPAEGKDFKDRNKAKRIKNLLGRSKTTFEELGMFSGSLSALYLIINFDKLRLMSHDPVEIQVLRYANTELLKLRRIFLECMGEEETVGSIVRFSSNKVQKLIHIIKEVADAANGKHWSILVFVKHRLTAVVLAFLFKRLGSVGSEFSFLKPEFVVGSNFISDSLFMGLRNQEIVKKFSCHSLNLLVATNLLEEGIDVSACNIVVSFDFPIGYPSYFQSRGRARNKDSTYFMFVESDDVEGKRKSVSYYKNIENEILKTVSQEYKFYEDCEASDDVPEKIYIPRKSGTIVLDGSTAIKVVLRYCCKLPQDKYCLLSPTSWYVPVDEGKKAFVQLPTNCPLRNIIEGEERKTAKSAKKSAFLCTVKLLFDLGELDEELNPRSYEVKVEDFAYLFPHYKKEKIDKNLPQPGTSKREQKYKVKFAESLSGCLPRPGAKAYLHVIKLTVTFDKPPLQRKVAIYEALKFSGTFALLTSKRLSKIFQFPLYLDMGQINCDLLVNYDEFVLTESQIGDIKQCHFALFKKITNVLKNSQVFDNRNKEHSFFVVPVEMNDEGLYVLNWDLIGCDYCKNSTSAVVRYNPSSNRGLKRSLNMYNRKMSYDDASENALVPINSINGRLLWGINQDGSGGVDFVMTEADYKYFVIFPNYRNHAYPQHYIVNKFCFDMSPLSPFPKVNFEDYVSYYKGTYMIDITNLRQPLLRVSPIYSCSNFNKPRGRKLGRERNKTYEEHLVPELCDIIPFDRRFYLKALLLPTILNRICHVYCVEEFRRKIVSETGLGVLELSEGEEWPPLDVGRLSTEEEIEDPFTYTPVKNKKQGLPLTKLKDETQVNQDFLDPERNLYEIGLCDLEFYVSAFKDSDVEVEQFKENDVVAVLSIPQDTPIPPLRILTNVNSASGPDLARLVQACTSTSANDVINYERLEVLGDALLKFAATLFVFRNFSENEGVLTSLKGKIVGNRNLMYCALAKGFSDIINVNDFVPSSDWNPPLIYIPERLVDEIVKRNLDPAVIYHLDIPPEEQFSGILSENTFQKNAEILQGFDKGYEMSTSSLLHYKVIKDKTVSDCVEAFIGAYLQALGIRGAFDFLLWLQVLPTPQGSYSELVEKPYGDPSSQESQIDVLVLLNRVFYSDLEDTLNYSFKDKALLLEAITHPSYSYNRITECYQRLELLGDAVLDLLITSYIYEYCGDLTPGEVTDIRSSLVNNITFACLCVRYNLHKYLLSFSSSLNVAIKNFVTFQASRNHVVDDNVLILLEECDDSIAEAVQVPKALGDVFESLAGAIYLDSGNSLETVWKIYYVMMKREIDEFTKTVPKTPVRMLYEICGDKPYFESQVVRSGLVLVSCVVYYDNEEIKTHGFGPNKKEAKRSAVKVALNEILRLKK